MPKTCCQEYKGLEMRRVIVEKKKKKQTGTTWQFSIFQNLPNFSVIVLENQVIRCKCHLKMRMSLQLNTFWLTSTSLGSLTSPSNTMTAAQGGAMCCSMSKNKPQFLSNHHQIELGTRENKSSPHFLTLVIATVMKCVELSSVLLLHAGGLFSAVCGDLTRNIAVYCPQHSAEQT